MKTLENTKSEITSRTATPVLETLLPVGKAFEGIESLFENGEAEIETELVASDFSEYIQDRYSGGTRKAVLAADVAKRAGLGDGVKVKLLALGYKAQTVADIFNAAGLVPLLREKGLLEYQAILNLTAVGKVLRDSSHANHKAVVKAIREGKSSAKVRAAYKPVAAKASERKPSGETDQTADENPLKGDVSAKEQAIRLCDALLALIGDEMPVTALCHSMAVRFARSGIVVTMK